jgi:hypothetical protein
VDPIKKQTDITKAEQVLADLNAKREALVARGHELAEQQQEISFKAHTGSKSERAKLDEINSHLLSHDYELRSIDAAIAQATKNLAAADQAQAHAQERENALALRAKVDEFVAHAIALDDALTAVSKEATALEETLKEIHLLGCSFPSRAQLDALGTRALKTAIMETPFRREFEHLAPRERQTFPALVGDWVSRIERQHITPLVGDLEVA